MNAYNGATMAYNYYNSEDVLFRQPSDHRGGPEIWVPSRKRWEIYVDVEDFFTTSKRIDLSEASRMIAGGDLNAPVFRIGPTASPGPSGKAPVAAP